MSSWVSRSRGRHDAVLRSTEPLARRLVHEPKPRGESTLQAASCFFLTILRKPLVMGGPWKCPACDEGFMAWKYLLEHATREGHTAYTRLRRQQQVDSKSSQSHTHQPGSGEKQSAPAQTNGPNNSAATLSSNQAARTSLGGTHPQDSQPSPSVPRVKCLICDLSFPSATDRDAHYKASFMHPRCGTCGKSCLDKTELSSVSRRTPLAPRAAAEQVLPLCSTSKPHIPRHCAYAVSR